MQLVVNIDLAPMYASINLNWPQIAECATSFAMIAYYIHVAWLDSGMDRLVQLERVIVTSAGLAWAAAPRVSIREELLCIQCQLHQQNLPFRPACDESGRSVMNESEDKRTADRMALLLALCKFIYSGSEANHQTQNNTQTLQTQTANTLHLCVAHAQHQYLARSPDKHFVCIRVRFVWVFCCGQRVLGTSCNYN